MTDENKRKYLVYKVTNRFDGKIYIGVHSTLNENDRYMGSGVEIKKAIKKEGKKSFIKEILFVFDTRNKMLAKEKELVTKEFCMREDTYNRIEGGSFHNFEGMIVVKDKNGETSRVYRNDPRYLSGELVPYQKGRSYNNGTVTVRDKEGNFLRVSIDDPRYISGELVHNQKGLKNPNKGHEPWNKNKTLSNKYKQKLSDAKKGKIHSEEAKLNMSRARMKRKIKCINNNKEYDTLKEAAEDIGLKNYKSIRQVLYCKRNAIYGYQFIYV